MWLMRCLFLIGAMMLSGLSWAQSSYHLAFTGTAPVTKAGFQTVNCAFEEAQLPVLLHDVPWKRAQTGTQSGTYDGFFLGSQNQERANYAVPSDPVYGFKWYYVVRAHSGLSPDQDDFFLNSFAANLGTARLKWLEKKLLALEGAKTPYSPNSIESTWSMLKFGRVDVVLDNESNVQKYKTEMDVQIFPATQRSVHVHFSKRSLQRSPTLLSRFNEGLRTCKNRYAPGSQ